MDEVRNLPSCTMAADRSNSGSSAARNYRADVALKPQPKRIGADFWPTPESLIGALVQHVLRDLPKGPIWECACGDGRLAGAMQNAGRAVIASDLDASIPLDFLHDVPPSPGLFGAICTNPPFRLLDPFIARGLHFLDCGVAQALVLLMRNDALMAGGRAGQGTESRRTQALVQLAGTLDCREYRAASLGFYMGCLARRSFWTADYTPYWAGGGFMHILILIGGKLTMPRAFNNDERLPTISPIRPVPGCSAKDSTEGFSTICSPTIHIGRTIRSAGVTQHWDSDSSRYARTGIRYQDCGPIHWKLEARIASQGPVVTENFDTVKTE